MQNFEDLIKGKTKEQIAKLIIELKTSTQSNDVKLVIQKLQQHLDG